MDLAVSYKFHGVSTDDLLLINGGAPSDSFLKTAGILATVSGASAQVAVAFPPAVPVAAGVTVLTGGLALTFAAVGGALKLIGK